MTRVLVEVEGMLMTAQDAELLRNDCLLGGNVFVLATGEEVDGKPVVRRLDPDTVSAG